MTHIRRLLLPFRAYLVGFSHSNSLFSYPRNTGQWKYGQLKLWVKSFQPVMQDRAVRFQYQLISQRRCIQTLCFSGIKVCLGSMYVQGSFYLWPRVAYAMDSEKNTFAEEDNTDLSSAPGLLEDDPYSFLALARKFWLPAFLVLTVLAGWGHPIALTVKVILFLLSTNPSPLSVYLFVEQPFYAKKVDVEDYKLLCLARVEMRDQKITLIGILGNWWVLQSSPARGEYFALGSEALNNS
ncbi:uncharacterized protein LOC122653532 isoform X2 [Telopea speciosissima]|uniref:uncharacterized protein LOC122653532 isoform X2 n=1 Tax=Telopea speciosissima TaxID=54955 RepID=UPI001CC35322|nr:uncharacterized protein LOC122653532 isoform X2 [Telopea speciosissima]